MNALGKNFFLFINNITNENLTKIELSKSFIFRHTYHFDFVSINNTAMVIIIKKNKLSILNKNVYQIKINLKT